MSKFDILVVGSGLFGSIVAYEAKQRGKSVLVVERRNHIGGNCYTECNSEINIHMYGAHIFRTNSKAIWNYMQQFCDFNNFVNSPVANYQGKLYNLPFNMNTFHALWGVNTPQEALDKIESQRAICASPRNLEEHVLNLVGSDIYEKLVKGYTEKQWGRPCSDLPASIMRRIPLRLTFDNNYFNDFYQGIPIGGYTPIFEKLLDGIEVRLGIDYLEHRRELDNVANLVVFTGTIDSYYNYRFNPLEYRSLRFENKFLAVDNYQGVAVMNFTDSETEYTRIIEHKHFERNQSPNTVISYEFPSSWSPGAEPYYPMEDDENIRRFQMYAKEAASERKVKFGGRLGEYRYYDMQDTIASALKKTDDWFA